MNTQTQQIQNIVLDLTDTKDLMAFYLPKITAAAKSITALLPEATDDHPVLAVMAEDFTEDAATANERLALSSAITTARDMAGLIAHLLESLEDGVGGQLADIRATLQGLTIAQA